MKRESRRSRGLQCQFAMPVGFGGWNVETRRENTGTLPPVLLCRVISGSEWESVIVTVGGLASDICKSFSRLPGMIC
jgi:hypothetical protein